jgi:CoA:oxalate CoA-transferase
MSSASCRAPALDGLRVLDFTAVMAGPYCTRMLADLGADVIKVEPPGGELGRNSAPFRERQSTVFASLNCGKRSIVLDLKDPRDVAIARRLAERSDVVVENFRPGVMRRLGLGYATLAEGNPGLVYCSICGFGQEGPLSDFPS